MFNWKSKLDKKSNTILFELFSETNRINIEPQLYAGKLLYERGFDQKKLSQTKLKLKEVLEEKFDNKNHKDDKKIAIKTVFKEVIFKVLISAILFYSFYNSSEIQIEKPEIIIDNKLAAWVLALLNLIPLLWIRRIIRKAIEKVQMDIRKNDLTIQRINSELY